MGCVIGHQTSQEREASPRMLLQGVFLHTGTLLETRMMGEMNW